MTALLRWDIHEAECQAGGPGDPLAALAQRKDLSDLCNRIRSTRNPVLRKMDTEFLLAGCLRSPEKHQNIQGLIENLFEINPSLSRFLVKNERDICAPESLWRVGLLFGSPQHLKASAMLVSEHLGARLIEDPSYRQDGEFVFSSHEEALGSEGAADLSRTFAIYSAAPAFLTRAIKIQHEIVALVNETLPEKQKGEGRQHLSSLVHHGAGLGGCPSTEFFTQKAVSFNTVPAIDGLRYQLQFN